MPDFVLDSLRGGSDDFTPASSLLKNTCTIAENVEFFASTLGERRGGCAISTLILTAAGIVSNANLEAVTWMYLHQPSDTSTFNDYELWVMTVNTVASGGAGKLFRFQAGSLGWSEIIMLDTPAFGGNQAYEVYGQSLHGKLFIAYRNGVTDRLHVWDGTQFRRTGLATTAAPTGANTGVGAYAATLRYYRTRSVLRYAPPVVNVRSEPSAVLTFTPSGAGTGVIVTRAALPGESETDWEIEVSLNGTTFYKLATVAAATTTYTDSAVTTTYADNVQSDPIGTYTLQPSVKFLSVDQDRLLLGSSWETAADASAVRWSPTGNDPSPGPDERFNSNTDPRVDLDGLENGGLSAMTRGISGMLYVMKRTAIYAMRRTGQLVGAYEAICITKSRGALPHSVVEACDEAGRPCEYFLDPNVGPMRAGANGLQYVGLGVKTLWQRVNRTATLSCHGVWYPDKQQVHYWVAQNVTQASPVLFPNTKIVLQTNEMVIDDRGQGRGGWSTVPLGDGIADARCSVMFVGSSLATTSLQLKPFIGKGRTGGVAIATVAIQICDNGDTTDNGTAFTARIRTRPFFLENILNRHGIMAGALLGSASSSVTITLRRDFGKETLASVVTLTPTGSEPYVLALLDSLSLAELFALEIEIGDNPLSVTQWQLLQLVLKERAEQTA